MRVHNYEQGSVDWIKCRLGVFTASKFSKVLSPKTMKLSAQSEDLENLIVAEILTGEPVETFMGNIHTERGNELEPEAVDFYEMQTGLVTEKVGFITNDAGTYGCSPDRLVGDEGLLEIKCPAANTHVRCLLEKSVGEDHKPQIQGQLLVTGRKWVDAFSYHPTLPPSIIRVERDEEYIEKLSAALDQLVENVAIKIIKIKS